MIEKYYHAIIINSANESGIIWRIAIIKLELVESIIANVFDTGPE